MRSKWHKALYINSAESFPWEYESKLSAKEWNAKYHILSNAM